MSLLSWLRYRHLFFAFACTAWHSNAPWVTVCDSHTTAPTLLDFKFHANRNSITFNLSLASCKYLRQSEGTPARFCGGASFETPAKLCECSLQSYLHCNSFKTPEKLSTLRFIRFEDKHSRNPVNFYSHCRKRRQAVRNVVLHKILVLILCTDLMNNWQQGLLVSRAFSLPGVWTKNKKFWINLPSTPANCSAAESVIQGVHFLTRWLRELFVIALRTF